MNISQCSPMQINNINKSHNIVFEKQEKEWIKNNPTIKVHNETNWPPYNYAKDGQPLGYLFWGVYFQTPHLHIIF